MYPPALILNNAESLAVTAAPAVFQTVLESNQTYAYCATTNSWLHQGPVALVVADVAFTTTFATSTLNIAAHGLLTGDGPVRVSSDDTLPAGLLAGTDYWVIKTGSGTLKLATSLANALAGTAVTLSDDGMGNHTLSDTASTARVAAATGGPGSCFVPATLVVYIDGYFGATLSTIRDTADGRSSLTQISREVIGRVSAPL